MKKYMLLIAASLVASALVTGCGSPAEGNTDTNVPPAANSATSASPDGEATAPSTSTPAPAPEDKK